MAGIHDDPAGVGGSSNGSMAELPAKPDAPLAPDGRASGAFGLGTDPVELAAAAGQGDLRAAQSLVELVAPAMHAAVRSVMGPNHPDVQDVVQQALIALVQSLPRFRAECQPGTYALAIAIRAALAARKRSLRDNRRLEALARQTATGHVDPRWPLDDVQAESRRALVRQLLDELPGLQAEALTLHVILDLPLKEVAEAVGVPVNTVKSRLRLAKRALRERVVADQLLAEEFEAGL